MLKLYLCEGWGNLHSQCQSYVQGSEQGGNKEIDKTTNRPCRDCDGYDLHMESQQMASSLIHLVPHCKTSDLFQKSYTEQISDSECNEPRGLSEALSFAVLPRPPADVAGEFHPSRFQMTVYSRQIAFPARACMCSARPRGFSFMYRLYISHESG
jgi:hypothetical protein